MRETVPEFDEATCLAIACPSCMTLDLARSCAGYVTTIINNADLIPTVSPGAVHRGMSQAVWSRLMQTSLPLSAQELLKRCCLREMLVYPGLH